MKENKRYTVEWAAYRYIAKCAAILPEDGLPWDTFLYSIVPECQYIARRLKNEGVLIVEDGIIKPNQIVKYNLKPAFADVIDLLSGAFSELETAVEEYGTQMAVTVEEKLEELYRWRKDFFGVEVNEIVQKQLNELDDIFRRVRPNQITEEQAKQIKRIHSDLSHIHYRMFGKEKERRIQKFHETRGKYLASFLEYAMTKVTFSVQALKNMYYELGEYYQLVNMWNEAVLCAERLLEIYEAQNEEDSGKWLIHMLLSERYLMCFETYPDYEKRSMRQLEMAQQCWPDPSKSKEPNLKLIGSKREAYVSNQHNGGGA